MTPERLAEIEAEAKNPKKFGWSNPEGTLLELAAHIRDLEAQVINADMGDEILGEIAGTLKELGCDCGPNAHLSTPPMFYREWMLCVMESAIRSATRDLEAQVREARVAFCEFHDMARNMARYLSTDGICHWIASEEFGAATPPSPEVGA